MTYHWKTLDEGYNFFSNLASIGGLDSKLWASKVMKVSIWGISRLQLGSLEIKWHLGIGLMTKHKDYYKGEGGGFSHVWTMVSLVSPCLPMAHSMHQKCFNYVLTNLLFGLCRFMWIIDPLVIHSSPHLRALARPSTLKVLRAKGYAPTPCPSIVFTFGLTIESI
jgi:hypothetical protein